MRRAVMTWTLLVVAAVTSGGWTIAPPDGEGALTPAEQRVLELIDDPAAIPLDQLKIIVRPLTQSTLKTLADAYRDLLQETVAQLSVVEVRELVEKASPPVEAAPADGENAADAEPADTAAPGAAAADDAGDAALPTGATAAELRSRRVAIVDRFRMVLAAFEERGGDSAPYKRYITAVSAITIDVTDAMGAWQRFTEWLQQPEGGVRWGRNLLGFVLTLLVAWIIARVVSSALTHTLQRSSKLSALMRDFISGIAGRVVLFIGLVVAISWLEVEVGPILALIGAAGFVVAFALQGTLSNFASGIMILSYKPFDVGDAVTVAGVSGIVDSMNLVSTNIRTFDNQKMLVPNNEIWGNVITNITGMPTRRLDMTFGIAYSDDAERAMQILDEVVRAHPLTLKDPEPMIKVHELGDSSVDLICRPWVKTSDYWTLRWDMIKTVKERFDAAGITIPFPQRDVHVFQAS